ncbi:polysaccharide biosynthesis tyrosine autokinase [Mycolicibacterium holsaticum]|uniref:polysaccharide biosynthesis tyrosine autokinase n=1 Tax=Mycolicibacterium holsaticum TaxID=152142 RepID=UPI001E2F6D74|nr:polysaccharide biosynthesis tyrosine autokinase [Mycolicibacterium holsaticum]
MEYLRIFRRYWWLIVALTIVGGAGGYAATLLLTPEYQSTARLFVATQNGTSVTEAYQNNLFSQERVYSYADLASSEQVAARAVDQLKAPISADELRSKVTALPGEKTVLLDVSVTDADPAQAQTYTNAVADQLVGLVSELETSRRGGSPAAGLVVVDEASYPTAPTGLGVLTMIVLGAVIGLVVGIVAAVLAGIVDKRLRGRESVEGAVGTHLLGALPAEPARATTTVVDLDGNEFYAERVRELRTNLRFAVPPGSGAPPRRIAVTSPSSGDGRTTVAIDLAAALAESGRSVVVVDGDLRGAELADRLGLDDQRRARALNRGVSTVIAGEHALAEAVIGEIPVGAHAIALLPAGPTASRPGEMWANDRATAMFEELARNFDYIVVDTPPLERYADGANVAALCDGAVLLARIGSTTSSALRRAIQALQTANVALIGTVATFERVGGRLKRQHHKQVQRDARPAARTGSVEGGRGADARAAGTETVATQKGQLVGSGNPRRTDGDAAYGPGSHAGHGGNG